MSEQHGGAATPRTRSPKHPAIDLGAAIKRLEEFHGEANEYPVLVTTACDVWRLSHGSGTANRLISTLLQFGLLEAVGKGKARQVCVTERGRMIATDPEGVTGERVSAIYKAALEPPVYRKVWDQWGPTLPNDRMIAPELKREYGFNSNAIDGFVRDFRATLEFAGVDKQGDSGEVEESESDSQGTGHNSNQRLPRSGERAKTKAPMTTSTTERTEVRLEDYSIPLHGAGTAVLSVPVPLSRKNYQSLKGWLEWAEYSLIDEPPAEDDEGDEQ